MRSILARRLRFDLPLDLALLEQVVSSLYQGTSPEQVHMAPNTGVCKPIDLQPPRVPEFLPHLGRRCNLPPGLNNDRTNLVPQIQASQRILSQLQERISGEEASSALNWFRVDTILESSSLSPNTKFYALQVCAISPSSLQ